jgi:hypothetical protein
MKINHLISAVAAWLVACWYAPAFAGAPLPAGTYVTEGGRGRLVIEAQPRSPENARQPFSITTIGVNLHVCQLEGGIQEGKAELNAGGKRCNLRFAREPGGLRVIPEPGDVCRFYCGQRAGFDYLYRRPAPACTDAAMERTRAAFLSLYQRRQYARARAKLAPLLAQCGPILQHSEDADIRNDLAVTLYHLGQRAACRKVLEPWREMADGSDDDLQQTYAPWDVGTYMEIAAKTRTNLRLCRGR